MLLLFYAVPLRAHMLSDLHVHAQIKGAQVTAQMRLSFHELGQWVELPRDDKGHIVIDKIPSLRPALADYLRQRILFQAGDPAQTCSFSLDDFLVDELSGLRLALRYDCAQPIDKVTLQSGLFVGSDHAYEMSWELRRGEQEYTIELDRQHNKGSVDFTQLRTQKMFSWSVVLVAVGLLLVFLLVALWMRWRTDK